MLKKFRSIYESSTFLKVVFSISLVVLIFISAVSYRHNAALKNSSELLVHSYNIHLELEQLMSYIKDAETSQRGYILTKDSSFLYPFNDVNRKVENSTKIIKMLVSGDIKQRANLDSLSKLISLRFDVIKKSLNISAYNANNSKTLSVSLLQGKKVMDSIRLLIDKMIDFELNILKERQKEYEIENSITPLFTLLVLLFSLLVFVFSYLKISKDLRNFKIANEDLIIKNESIIQAEEIGEFSTWKWDLTNNKLSYSDNQYRLLGCEPQSFEPTIENYLAFVHPDDRHIITDGTNQVMKYNKTPVAYFRIIKKDGKLRYFKSVAKEITDVIGKKTLIGINSDITEQQLNSMILEDKNKTLEQTNKELASFNHIASHDLQEPLRKIQTFISRISQNDIKSLPQSTKDYLEGIDKSANRMRMLIDDLLMFSRTNKTKKDFELYDLNLSLTNAKEELAIAIAEKNAVVTSVQLPKLKVIPFQIKQLFINIIGNSIKYARVGLAPVVKIDCEKVNAKDYLVLQKKPTKKFLKISISDNGMGFDPQNADNIFNLFHRLHNSPEYPGTGIGLSICKKIIENHDGVISATSTPNVGSTFSIFLPA
jgi:signal transduction histidine kinase/CHASE3 domain sensor protein